MRIGHPDVLAISDRLDDLASDGLIDRAVAQGTGVRIRGLARAVSDGDMRLALAIRQAEALASFAEGLPPLRVREWRAAA